jgi:hypothetical protein
MNDSSAHTHQRNQNIVFKGDPAHNTHVNGIAPLSSPANLESKHNNPTVTPPAAIERTASKAKSVQKGKGSDATAPKGKGKGMGRDGRGKVGGEQENQRAEVEQDHQPITSSGCDSLSTSAITGTEPEKKTVSNVQGSVVATESISSRWANLTRQNWTLTFTLTPTLVLALTPTRTPTLTEP